MSALRISVPGQPIRRIVDTDPELALTPRQREYVIATIRALGYPARSHPWSGPHAAHPPMEGEAMTLDPDPLHIEPAQFDWYNAGRREGYREAAERRRLAVQPFLWGVAFGAAITLIIVLAIGSHP